MLESMQIMLDTINVECSTAKGNIDNLIDSQTLKNKLAESHPFIISGDFEDIYEEFGLEDIEYNQHSKESIGKYVMLPFDSIYIEILNPISINNHIISSTITPISMLMFEHNSPDNICAVILCKIHDRDLNKTFYHLRSYSRYTSFYCTDKSCEEIVNDYISTRINDTKRVAKIVGISTVSDSDIEALRPSLAYDMSIDAIYGALFLAKIQLARRVGHIKNNRKIAKIKLSKGNKVYYEPLDIIYIGKEDEIDNRNTSLYNHIQRNPISYSFDVMGHWRRLTGNHKIGHDRVGNILSNGFTWVKPHQRGNGDYIPKTRVLV